MIPIAKPFIGREEAEAAARALESGTLTGGPVVEEFEKKLASYCGYRHAVAVNSGTAGLHVACAALGVGEGHGVIVPSFTFIATANAPRYLGAVPIFADVDPRTFNISPKSVAAAAKNIRSLKAIIPVSLFGQYYDFSAIHEIAKAEGIGIISDNCQAIGAEWKGKKNAGEDCSVLSFYPTKNMTTCEGGAVLTDSPDIAEECRLWRNIGQRKPYDYAHIGYNYRMTSVHAAIGIEQLRKLDSMTAARRKNAKLFNELLEKTPAIETPLEHPDARHVYNQYTVKVLAGAQKRDGLRDFLAKNGVGAAIYYPVPLSALPVFADIPHAEGSDTNASALAGQVISLPVHPSVSEEDVKFIAGKVREFFFG